MERGPVLQRAFTVAQTPRPLDPDNGRILAADVHNIVNSRKRKRPELAVAVDGESVNLYDVKTSRSISSYAVPPHSFFECPPCSVRIRLDRSKSAIRRTFCAVRSPDVQLMSYVDEEQGKSITTTKRSLRSWGDQKPTSKDSIVAIDTIQSPGPYENSIAGDSPLDVDVISVQKNGTIQRLSGDLQDVRWTKSIFDLIPQEMRQPNSSITAVFFEDLDVTRATVLKKREDVIGNLSDGNDYEISIAISHSQDRQHQNLSAHVFAIAKRQSTATSILSHDTNISHLLTKQISHPGTNFAAASQFSLHSVTGSLQFRLGDSILTYDLCEHIPHQTSSLQISPSQEVTFLRTSSSSMLVSNPESITLFNLQYQSIQASIRSEEVLPKQPKKGQNPPQIKLLSFYAKSNVVVALTGHSLIGLPLNLKTSKRRAEGLLIDSIGRGIPAKRVKFAVDSTPGGPFKLISKPSDDYWASLRKELETLHEAGKVKEFEERMAEALSSSQSKKHRHKRKQEEKDLGTGLPLRIKNEIASSPSSSPSRPDALKVPSMSDYVDEDMLLYLISKIFSWDNDKQALYVSNTNLPRRLFRWLLMTRRLSAPNVELSLRRNGQAAFFQLPAGSLSRAIISFDRSLSTLLLLLKSPSLLLTSETVHIVKSLLEFDNPESQDEPQLLLTNGTSSLVQPTSKSISQFPEQTPSLFTVTTALNTTLTALQTHHPTQAVTASLRAFLPPNATLTIIHHLRLCLANGGWTSRYTDHFSDLQEDPNSPSEEPTPLSLPVIANLLNCCIDAIGPLGFLSNISPSYTRKRADSMSLDDDNDETMKEADENLDQESEADAETETEEDLIPHLRAEISATLTGIEESSYLRGILREFLRYSSSTTPISKPLPSILPSTNHANALTTESEPNHTKLIPKKTIKEGPATIYTLISKDSTTMGAGMGGSAEEGLLPLSLKAEESENELRMKSAGRGGGMVERSRREMGMLYRRRVGEYSLERVVI